VTTTSVGAPPFGGNGGGGLGCCGGALEVSVGVVLTSIEVNAPTNPPVKSVNACGGSFPAKDR